MNSTLQNDGPAVNREQRIAELYQQTRGLAQRTVQSAWECGRELACARDQAERHEGGFRGVLARTKVPRSTAYLWIQLWEAYPEVSSVGHFTSIRRAMEDAKPKAAPVTLLLDQSADSLRPSLQLGDEIIECQICDCHGGGTIREQVERFVAGQGPDPWKCPKRAVAWEAYRAGELQG